MASAKRFTLYGYAVMSDGNIGIVADKRLKVAGANASVSVGREFVADKSYPNTNTGRRRAAEYVYQLNAKTADSLGR